MIQKLERVLGGFFEDLEGKLMTVTGDAHLSDRDKLLKEMRDMREMCGMLDTDLRMIEKRITQLHTRG